MPVQSLFDVEESAGAAFVDAGTGVAMLLVGTFLSPSVIVTTLEIPYVNSEAAGDRGVEKSDEDDPVVDKLKDEPEDELHDEVVSALVTVNEVVVPLVVATSAAEALKSQSFATKTSV
ncbi:hypothetical protein KCU95_g16266, partial [Aureobasidium melanogenum]